MYDSAKLIICHETVDTEKTALISRLSKVELDSFGFTPEQCLENLTFQILKQPTVLDTHIQRIVYCYQHHLNEPLYAALVDLLIVLSGKGTSLGLRMIKGAKSKLHPEQYAMLKGVFAMPPSEVKWLKGNLYSLFSRGVIGTPHVIFKEECHTQQVIDPLEIARDFVAYSQLEDAIETLEQAILVHLDRQELHHDLLELYKVTLNFERFEQMHSTLLKHVKTLPVGWDELKGYFNAR
jgi:hypothetical protein